MTEPETKVCKLCGQAAVLRNSHIIPRWVSKRVLHGIGGTPARQFLVRMQDGTVRQESTQLKEQLLCDPCEQRFSRPEGYAEKQVVQRDGSFPMISGRLPTALSLVGEGALGQFHNPALDTEQMSLFALSVFWRAHACTKISHFDLGPLAEPVHAACLGGAKALPPLMVTALARSTEFPIDAFFTWPSQSEVSFNFVVLGVQFDLALDRNLLMEACCFRRTGAFFLSDGDHLVEPLAKLVFGTPMGGLNSQGEPP